MRHQPDMPTESHPNDRLLIAAIMVLLHQAVRQGLCRCGEPARTPAARDGTATQASRRTKSKPKRLRRRALALVKKHYGGNPGERFGPTLAAEHLAEDHQVEVDETLRRWMLVEGLWTCEAKTQAVPATGRAPLPFWRTGANGWQLRVLAGKAWTEGLPPAYG